MHYVKTPFMGYSVKWSPFEENKLAIATAQHFGIVGNGKQHVIEIDLHQMKQGPMPNTPYQLLPCKQRAIYNTRDGVYDCAWSELNENHIVSACGDGTIRLWDMASKINPLRAYMGHNAEIYSIDWNLVTKQHFVSGCWDRSCKVWDPTRTVALSTFNGHEAVVYDSKWCPHNTWIFASTSEDKHLNLWDIRNNNNNNGNTQQGSSKNMIISIPAHNHEVLSCDWNKYNKNLIATGSCDRSIKIWDLRNVGKPMIVLEGHRFAVRRVKFSPFNMSSLMSVSYDMSIKFWDFNVNRPTNSNPNINMNPMIASYDHHSEFVVGCDYNIFHENLVAACSWDEKVSIFYAQSQINTLLTNPMTKMQQQQQQQQQQQHPKPT